MQKMGDVIKNQLSKVRTAKEERNMLDPLAGQLVEQIFVKIALLCRGFDSFYADRNRLNAEKTQWVMAFTKLNIRSRAQIQHALNKMERHKFPNPPQLGEFLDWCNPTFEDIGFPDAREAFRLSGLINRRFSDYIHADSRVDTVIKHVIGQIGATEFRAMPEKTAFKIFESYYGIACRQFMEGKLKEIQRALPQKAEPHPIDRKKSDAARIAAMHKLKGILGKWPTTSRAEG